VICRTFDLQHSDSHTLARGVAVGVGLLAHLGDGLSAVLNFVGVDDGVANGASNVPLVGVGDVLALLHGLRDTVGVANRLDGLGDAGVVEGGVGAPVEGLGISLPLANVAVAKKMGFKIFNLLCLWMTPEARPRV